MRLWIVSLVGLDVVDGGESVGRDAAVDGEVSRPRQRTGNAVRVVGVFPAARTRPYAMWSTAERSWCATSPTSTLSPIRAGL